MNYQRIYDNLMLKAKTRGLTKANVIELTERHHILPRCLGGTDEMENLVVLYTREHFLAHWLLYKIHRIPPLAFAFSMMCTGFHRPISHLYKYARKACSEVRRGTKHSEETRKRMSLIKRGLLAPAKKPDGPKRFDPGYVSEATREKLRLSSTGRTHSPEVRKKLSEQRVGMKQSSELIAKRTAHQFKPVIGTHRKTGEKVAFPSATHAANELGCCRRGIYAAISGREPHYAGYFWSRSEGELANSL